MVAHYSLLRDYSCFIAASNLQISRILSLSMQTKDSSPRAEVTYEWSHSSNSPIVYNFLLCSDARVSRVQFYYVQVKHIILLSTCTP